MSILPVGFGSSGGLQITNSVRLRASASAYFSRTFGTPTTQDTFTFSAWVKRSKLATLQNLLGVSTNTSIGFPAADTLVVTCAGSATITTSGLYRDPSAWCHVQYKQTTGAATLYFNGTSVGTSATVSAVFNTAVAHQLGAANTSNYTDGYLSDVYFIDGQALTPSSFCETNSDGVWVPKAYTGTYGNNGFHLDFSDGTSATTLGYDAAGSNDWTPSGISTTAGVTYDWMEDTPTNNFATLNPLTPAYTDGAGTAVISGANLNWTPSAAEGSAEASAFSTVPFPTTGKWYAEVYVTTAATLAAARSQIGICTAAAMRDTPQTYGSAGYYAYLADGNKITSTAGAVAYGSTWTSAATIGIEFDADALTLTFFKNDVSQGVAFTVAAGTYHLAMSYWGVFSANFGQRPFTYPTRSSGAKALCTANLPAVAIAKPANGIKHRWEAGSGIAANVASDRTGWTNWIEIFKRTDTTEDWKLRFSSDTGNMMACNTNAAKTAWSAPSAGTYLGLAIQAEATYGSVTGTYTGDNTANRNITHSLGRAPTCGIVKNEASGDWFFWHAKMTSAAYFTIIDSASPPAQSNTNTPWGTGNWSSTQFMVTNNATNNANANAAVYRYILFSDISGMLAMLGFTGNGSTDGAFEWANQRPQIQIEKDLAAATGFYLFSDLIDTYNVTASYLVMNTTAATAAATGVDIVSNGIKHRSATIANAANAYAAISFARYPFGGSNVSPSPAR